MHSVYRYSALYWCTYVVSIDTGGHKFWLIHDMNKETLMGCGSIQCNVIMYHCWHRIDTNMVIILQYTKYANEHNYNSHKNCDLIYCCFLFVCVFYIYIDIYIIYTVIIICILRCRQGMLLVIHMTILHWWYLEYKWDIHVGIIIICGTKVWIQHPTWVYYVSRGMKATSMAIIPHLYALYCSP